MKKYTDYTEFSHILEAEGMTQEHFDEKTKDFTPGEKGERKIAMIVRVLNKTEDGEPIWYPWFWKRADDTTPSGSALSLRGTDDGLSYADVPARLKYNSERLAEYAGTTFLAEYEEHLLLL